jgi:hypothetical protein
VVWRRNIAEVGTIYAYLRLIAQDALTFDIRSYTDWSNTDHLGRSENDNGTNCRYVIDGGGATLVCTIAYSEEGFVCYARQTRIYSAESEEVAYWLLLGVVSHRINVPGAVRWRGNITQNVTDADGTVTVENGGGALPLWPTNSTGDPAFWLFDQAKVGEALPETDRFELVNAYRFADDPTIVQIDSIVNPHFGAPSEPTVTVLGRDAIPVCTGVVDLASRLNGPPNVYFSRGVNGEVAPYPMQLVPWGPWQASNFLDANAPNPAMSALPDPTTGLGTLANGAYVAFRAVTIIPNNEAQNVVDLVRGCFGSELMPLLLFLAKRDNYAGLPAVGPVRHDTTGFDSAATAGLIVAGEMTRDGYTLGEDTRADIYYLVAPQPVEA